MGNNEADRSSESDFRRGEDRGVVWLIIGLVGGEAQAIGRRLPFFRRAGVASALARLWLRLARRGRDAIGLWRRCRLS